MKIKIETGTFFESQPVSTTNVTDQIILRSKQRKIISGKYTTAYMQPWYSYWIGKLYHHVWCMNAHRFLKPIDAFRDWRNNHDYGRLPVDVQRDFRCHALLIKNRTILSNTKNIETVNIHE